MKKIVSIIFFLLSLMVCWTYQGWAGAVEDVNAGVAAVKAGEYEEAISFFTKAIESGELSQEDLSAAYDNRGNAWFKKGEYDNAIADYTQAIEIVQDIILTSVNRVRLLKSSDRRIMAYSIKILEIGNEQANIYYNRGVAWENKGDNDRAIADYTSAFDRNTKHVSACNSLAWLMATCPDDRYRDGKQAVEFAKKAVKLEKAAFTLDTLAAAYAEAGRFQDAIKTQEKAIAKLKKEETTKAIPEYEEHLASYEAGKPWREK